MGEILDVVDKNDTVIGQVDRDLKQDGQIVRMVFVGFYTARRDIFLQRRSLQKRSSPGKLTSTVSGHVSSGQAYLEAAIRETREETEIVMDESKIASLGVMLGGSAMRAVYAYPFDGSVFDLTVEEGEGAGFVRISVEELLDDRHDHPGRYAPFIKTDAGTVLLDYITHV